MKNMTFMRGMLTSLFNRQAFTMQEPNYTVLFNLTLKCDNKI
jgi:hypothetical protein